MSLPADIAHYRITSKLGEGGMGTVYCATDTKLNRDVAIKVLPDIFAQDPDRMARFAREAHVLASLNHPNIAAIYGVEEHALVMELVEGETLADRMARGAIPIEDAVPIAVQIAEALEYAHEKGIIHRDLKPANIKVTPHGQVKVLDFGLAKALSSEIHGADPAASPTLTMRATMAGVIMGTAAYMSPEQAKGKPVDRRADIWAFGVIFYEMLTGSHIYGGETVSDTLAAVLTRDPDWNLAPARFRPLLRRCLDRDSRMRLRDIGEARVALQIMPVAEKSETAKPLRPWLVPVLSVALVVALAVLGTVLLRKPSNPELPARRFTLAPRSLAGYAFNSSAAISPNGKRIAYVAEGKLWVRELDREEPRTLDGTEGALGPFWSPDSEALAYAAREQLWTTSLRGGAPVAVCSLASNIFFGGAWSPDGKTLLFSMINLGLMKVPSAGGEQQLAFKPTGETGAFFFNPQFLPEEFGSDSILVGAGDLSVQRTLIINLRSGESRDTGFGAFAAYSPTGHIIYRRENAGTFGLWAVPVSRTLARQGAPFPLAPGGTMPSVSNDGTLIYTDDASNLQLVLRDYAGKKLGVVGSSQMGINYVAVSPDGKKVAVNSTDQGSMDIWVHDLERSLRSRSTSLPGMETYAKWSPDGRQLAFRSGTDILVQPADGTGEAVPMVKSPQVKSPGDWSADGQYLIYTLTGAQRTSSSDLWYLKKKTDGGFDPVPYLETRNEESSPRFSPSAKFVAYLSNEPGRFELYVRPFPEGSGKWQVSTNGGIQPRWRRDGKELFFLEGENLMAAAVTSDGAFSVGAVKRLFSVGAHLQDRNSLKYDIMPDGRILILEAPEELAEKSNVIHVIENWPAAFLASQGGKRE